MEQHGNPQQLKPRHQLLRQVARHRQFQRVAVLFQLLHPLHQHRQQVRPVLAQAQHYFNETDTQYRQSRFKG